MLLPIVRLRLVRGSFRTQTLICLWVERTLPGLASGLKRLKLFVLGAIPWFRKAFVTGVVSALWLLFVRRRLVHFETFGIPGHLLVTWGEVCDWVFTGWLVQTSFEFLKLLTLGFDAWEQSARGSWRAANWFWLIVLVVLRLLGVWKAGTRSWTASLLREFDRTWALLDCVLVLCLLHRFWAPVCQCVQVLLLWKPYISLLLDHLLLYCLLLF